MNHLLLRIIKTIVMNNPIGLFIRMVLTKWSLIIILPSIMVTYWVLLGLHNVGVLNKTFTVISYGLSQTKAVAQNCTPKILDLKALWSCIESPGMYINHPAEMELHRRLRVLENPEEIHRYMAPDIRDPYSEFYEED